MFSYLQKIGRSLMIPVAVLPAAAILLGIGYWIDPTGWGSNSVLATILIKSGAAIIDNMSILFALGVAFGMSKDKSGNAALTGLVGFMVVTTLLSPAVVGMLTKAEVVPAAFGKINNQFIGILVGVIAAELYNRYSAIQLPKAFAFFSGKRLVPIIMSFVMMAVSFILLFVWPFVYDALVSFGTFVQGMGSAGAGIFGFANRLLIPFGLHHALNSVFWFDIAGINDIPNFLSGGANAGAVAGVTGMYQAGFFPIMMFGLVGAAVAFVKTAKPENKTKVKSLMIAAGFASFLTGVTEPLEFAFMFVAPQLYLLHAVFTGISMYIAAEMQWMSGFAFSAGFIDMVLSAKNPLAVQWFMLIIQGLLFFVMYYFGFTFFIKKFKLKTPGREISENSVVTVADAASVETAQAIIPLLGGIKNILNIDNCVTRLRLELADSALVQESELNKIVAGTLILDKKSVQVVIGTQVEFVAEALQQLVDGALPTATATVTPGSHGELASAILPLLGGKKNITSVDNCITRLRLEVKNSEIVKTEELKKITAGVITPGKKSVQVIIGTDVEFVAEEFKKLV